MTHSEALFQVLKGEEPSVAFGANNVRPALKNLSDLISLGILTYLPPEPSEGLYSVSHLAETLADGLFDYRFTFLTTPHIYHLSYGREEYAGLSIIFERES